GTFKIRKVQGECPPIGVQSTSAWCESRIAIRPGRRRLSSQPPQTYTHHWFIVSLHRVQTPFAASIQFLYRFSLFIRRLLQIFCLLHWRHSKYHQRHLPTRSPQLCKIADSHSPARLRADLIFSSVQ